MVTAGAFAVLTDEPKLDVPLVLAALEKMREMAMADLGELAEPTHPVPLVVFAREADYRAFWPRFARLFGGESPEPTAGGYTALGVATTSFSGESGSVRPVVPHEACHAMLARTVGLANRGEWLHEGLANRYQLRFSKQDIRGIVRQALDDPTCRSPLEALVCGEPIPRTRYWQALTFVEWLTAEPERKARFRDAVRLMRRRCSTDLSPIAGQVFGADLDEIERRWLEWLRQEYGDS